MMPVEQKQVETVKDLTAWMEEFRQSVTTGKTYITSSINKLNKMPQHQQSLAMEGAQRYFRACFRMDIPLEISPIREIIEDAADNRQIWKESDNQFKNALGLESEIKFKEKLSI